MHQNLGKSNKQKSPHQMHYQEAQPQLSTKEGK